MRLDLLAPLGPVAIVILKTTLLLALGATGDRVLHRAPAVARHLVWLTAIVGALLVPVFDRYMPMRVAVLPAPMSTLVSATANGVGVSSLPNADGAPPASDASRSVSARRRRIAPSRDEPGRRDGVHVRHAFAGDRAACICKGVDRRTAPRGAPSRARPYSASRSPGPRHRRTGLRGVLV